MASMADFVTTVNLSRYDRIRNATVSFTNHLTVGITELINAPVSAFLCLIETQRTYINQIKIGKAATAAQKEANKQAVDEFKELMDDREPWKKQHDEEYGES